jgi:hypothetical protein
MRHRQRPTASYPVCLIILKVIVSLMSLWLGGRSSQRRAAGLGRGPAGGAS